MLFRSGSTSQQAESDGRVYLMSTAGSLTMCQSAFLSTVADGTPLGHHASAVNASHAGYYKPATTTIRTSSRFGSFTPSATFTTADNEPVGVPYTLQDSVNLTFMGAARNWYMTKDQFSRVTVVNGADRKSTRLNSSHVSESRMPSSA